jgi:hypothetical protein
MNPFDPHQKSGTVEICIKFSVSKRSIDGGNQYNLDHWREIEIHPREIPGGMAPAEAKRVKCGLASAVAVSAERLAEANRVAFMMTLPKAAEAHAGKWIAMTGTTMDNKCWFRPRILARQRTICIIIVIKIGIEIRKPVLADVKERFAMIDGLDKVGQKLWKKIIRP